MIIIINESLLYEKKEYDFFRKIKIFRGISDEDMRKIYEADPSESKQYVQWLLLLYYADKLRLEDLYKATEYLTVYERIKAKDRGTKAEEHKILKPEYRDLNKTTSKRISYKDEYDGKTKERNIKVPVIDSLDKLFSIIEDYMDSKAIETSSKLKDRNRIYSSEKWDVYNPRDYKSSCVLGSGTQWCTAVDDGDSATFDSYNDYGNLYIFDYKGNKKEKWQLYVEEGTRLDDLQFMNYKDSSDDITLFVMDNPELYDLVKKILFKSQSNELHRAIFKEVVEMFQIIQRKRAFDRIDAKLPKHAQYWAKKIPYYIEDNDGVKSLGNELIINNNAYKVMVSDGIVNGITNNYSDNMVNFINNFELAKKVFGNNTSSYQGRKFYKINISGRLFIYFKDLPIMLEQYNEVEDGKELYMLKVYSRLNSRNAYRNYFHFHDNPKLLNFANKFANNLGIKICDYCS